jgi:signal transduction histidine kinase
MPSNVPRRRCGWPKRTSACLFDEVAKSNKNLSEFLAVLAHELRNPLAPILTGLEIMRLRADSPRRSCQRARNHRAPGESSWRT